MWKWILCTAIATLLAAIVITWQAERCEAAYEECQAATATNPLPNTVGSVHTAPYSNGNKKQTPNQASGACTHSNSYLCLVLTPANLPTIYLVLIGIGGIVVAIGTLKILEEQTKAALLNAQAVLNSERAWMIAEIVDPGIPAEIEGSTGIRWTGFSVRFVNKGKTPAFLLEVGHCGRILPHEQNLPAIQPAYGEKETYRWDGKGMPLLPDAGIRRNHLGTWANDPVKITRGYEVLWVYGYIKYTDAFGLARETWYCYRWVPEIEKYQAPGFIAGGPESYNRAT